MTNRTRIVCIAASLSLAGASLAGAPPIIGKFMRVDSGTKDKATNETSVAALLTSTGEILATFNDWRNDNGSDSTVRCGVGLSLDGENWTDFTVRPPKNNQAQVEGDPMTAYDPRTNTLWVGAISFASNGGLYIAKKVNGKNEFEASKMAKADGSADKCWMAAGPGPGDPDKTSVYIAYSAGLLYSADTGDTWKGPTSLGSGIGFLPRVAPDGTVYVAYWDLGSNFILKRSTDGGKTVSAAKTIAKRVGNWGIDSGPFPGDFRVPPFVVIATDPVSSDVVYSVFMDQTKRSGGNTDIDVYFTKSTNRGDSWAKPKIINGDVGNIKADSLIAWLECDRRGRLHVFYYDTRNKAQNDSDTKAFLDAYYCYSDDAGETWSEMRMTDAYFEMNSTVKWFMGDYIGAASVKNKTHACMMLVDANKKLHSYVVTVTDPRGDMNCDGVNDFIDIDGFVAALIGQDTYQALHPDCDYQRGDINNDNLVNFDDIDGFIDILVNG